MLTTLDSFLEVFLDGMKINCNPKPKPKKQI